MDYQNLTETEIAELNEWIDSQRKIETAPDSIAEFEAWLDEIGADWDMD
jgi:hypothetical protein